MDARARTHTFSHGCTGWARPWAQSTRPETTIVLPSWVVRMEEVAMRPWTISLTHAGMPTVLVAAPSQVDGAAWVRVLTRAATMSDSEGPSTRALACADVGPVIV